MKKVLSIYRTEVKMNAEDLKADVEMYLQQMLELENLMIESGNISIVNLITLRDLAENAIKSAKKM